MRKIVFFLLLCQSYLFCERQTPCLLQMGLGVFDFHRDCRTPQLTVEYKWSFPDFGKVHSLSGILVNGKGALYIYSGFDFDIFLGKHLVITPSFCPGVYFNGKGKNMGYPLEFRSSVEVAFVFNNHSRIGVQGYHISNGSFAQKNPGEESLVIFYSLPL